MVRSKPPPRYISLFAQSGIAADCGNEGDGSGKDGSAVRDTSGDGGDSVVKALTALQVL